MEAKELRIGNWYQNKSNDEKLKYQQITFFEDAHYVATYCEPIPLTEKWLLNFGFDDLSLHRIVETEMPRDREASLTE
jgi:hypothetical protein